MTLQELRNLLLEVTSNTFHYEATKQTDKYIVWAEDSQGSTSYADNHMTMQGISGTIDFYTREEFDPMFDLIQQKLNSADLTWGLNSIEYEVDTKYIHYEWIFEVVQWLK
jgi:hypothetical protein